MKSRYEGKTRTGEGSRRLRWTILVLLAVAAIGSGCKKNASTRRPQPTSGNVAVADPAPANPVTVPDTPIPAADRLFDLGAYAEAARAYEELLASESGPAPPETLVRLAMAYVLASESDSKRARILQLLRQVQDLPDPGRVGPIAQTMLELMERNRSMAERSVRDGEKIKRLTDELERLKKIDLRQRPPG